MNIDQIIAHARNRNYLSEIERDEARIKATGEVFSPHELVVKILDRLDQDLFKDPSQTFIDPAGCGDGAFLSEVLIRKCENGIDFETALSTIYGVDIMEDNVQLCRRRLLCGQEHLHHIVEKNIVCHDVDSYDFSFNGTDKSLSELHFDNLFSLKTQ